MILMPRYVLLYHECPPEYERPSHWDLMLETDGKLRTWALCQLPCGWEAARAQTATQFASCPALAKEDSVSVERLADHRIDYLYEEGALTGNRGEVHRIDSGNYATVAQDSKSWTVALTGNLLQGRLWLHDSMLKLNP
jgi:hypothetical protein